MLQVEILAALSGATCRLKVPDEDLIDVRYGHSPVTIKVKRDVAPEGPAMKAGLKGGDRIIKVGTVDIRGINDLMFVLQAAKPGTETKIIFVRNGKEQTVTATFGVPRGKR